MSANILRLIAGVMIVITGQMNYGMESEDVDDIDKQLLINYIKTSGGPEVIKQIIADNKVKHDANPRPITRNSNGLSDYTPYALLAFMSPIYPHDSSLNYIFDRIACLEKQGGYRPQCQLLAGGSYMLSHKGLTQCTCYFHYSDDPLNPFVMCATSFYSKHLQIIEKILSTYSSVL